MHLMSAIVYRDRVLSSLKFTSNCVFVNRLQNTLTVSYLKTTKTPTKTKLLSYTTHAIPHSLLNDVMTKWAPSNRKRFLQRHLRKPDVVDKQGQGVSRSSNENAVHFNMKKHIIEQID